MHADRNWRKPKVTLISFMWSGPGSLGHGAITSVVSQKWIGGLKWFFISCYWCRNFR